MKIPHTTLGLFTEDYGYQQFRMASTFTINSSKFEIQINLFTEKNTYSGIVREKHLNREITWNQNSFSLLYESLQGLNPLAFLIFDEYPRVLKFGADILQSMMKVIFFQIKMKDEEESSTSRMKVLFHGIRKFYEDSSKYMKKVDHKLVSRIQEIQRMKLESKENYEFQVNYMKDGFLRIINDKKKKLKGIVKRFIEEVDEKYPVTKPQKQTPIEQSPEQVQQKEGFQALF